MRKGWKTAKLKELSLVGISNGVFNDPKKVGRGYKLINVVDLYAEPYINYHSLKLYDANEREYASFGVHKHDLFFTRSSLKLEGIAHCNIFNQDFEDVLYECHIMRVRPNQNLVDPYYLLQYCNSREARKCFMQNAKTTTMTTIDQKGVGDLLIPLPSLHEQRKIAAILRTWDAAIENLEAIKSRKQKLFQLNRMRLTNPNLGGDVQSKMLSEISVEINCRNDGTDVPVMMISSTQGFIRQDDNYDREMAGESLKNYILLQEGEFAYNKGNSKTYPYGCVFRLSVPQALIPFVYICFRLHDNLNHQYFQHYFEAGGLNRQLMLAP